MDMDTVCLFVVITFNFVNLFTDQAPYNEWHEVICKLKQLIVFIEERIVDEPFFGYLSFFHNSSVHRDILDHTETKERERAIDQFQNVFDLNEPLIPLISILTQTSIGSRGQPNRNRVIWSAVT